MHPCTTQLALHAGHHSGLLSTLQMSDMNSDSLETSSTSQAQSVGALCGACCSPHIACKIHVCVYGVCVRGGGGYNIWFINTTAAEARVKGRRMQVYVRVYKLFAYVMPTNESYSI